MKNEYTQTKFKVIGKARFPYLLNEMWSTDAIKTKTNIVKSFMKAGIFPLNPSSIDHSRILQNTAVAVSSSSSTTADTSDHDSAHNSPASNNLQTFDRNTHTTSNNSSSITNVTRSSEPTSSMSSSQAISLLDQLLQETQVSDDSLNDESDDEDYLPPKTMSTSSISVTSKPKKIQTKNVSTSNNNQSISFQRSNKRKRVSWDTIGFDDSDEGNFDNSNTVIVENIFLSDETISNPSPSKSQQSPQTIQRAQSKDLPTLKLHQSASSQQKNKRTKGSSEIDDVEILDEQGSLDIFLISMLQVIFAESMNPKPSSTNSQQSLDAINNTLKKIFGSSPSQSTTKSTKRTVLKRSNGQIMTENDVIEQMEEKNKKKRSSQSSSINQRSNQSKNNS